MTYQTPLSFTSFLYVLCIDVTMFDVGRNMQPLNKHSCFL